MNDEGAGQARQHQVNPTRKIALAAEDARKIAPIAKLLPWRLRFGTEFKVLPFFVVKLDKTLPGRC